jgi:glycosyltransferase involved in cell wall biosynthesis
LTEPLRIAYLTSFYARPSDSFIRNEVNKLRERGVEVHTFSIRRPSVVPSDEPDVDWHQHSTEYLLEAPLPRFMWHTLCIAGKSPKRFVSACRLAWRTAAPGIRGGLRQIAYLVEAAYLAARLRELGVALLHNHFGENSATVAMLSSELSGVPFSHTIHGPYVFFAPEKWALGEKLERASATICISDFCRSQCQMFASPTTWDRLHVVRCSVQPIFVEPPPPRSLPLRTHFLCVGRLCAEKGQLLILDAVHRLRDQGVDVHVSFVGDGPLRPAMERRIAELKLGRSIEFLGWQASGRVRELLAGSTALVIASAAEGLPVVAMESLAVGCPVIATNIAAMSELIEDRHCGWLISAGSTEHLADAMRCASQCDAETLVQMGLQGRQRVLELHHPQRQSEALHNLLLAASQKPATARESANAADRGYPRRGGAGSPTPAAAVGPSTSA